MSVTERRRRGPRWVRPLLAGLVVLTMAACAPSVSPTPAESAPAAEAPATETVTPTVDTPATATVAPAAVERTGAATPEEAARAYYEWYLEYTRPNDDGEFKNPLVDEAYAASPYLTAGLAERVGEILASFEGGGYDPFLCAQDVPMAFTVGPAEVADGEARLTVYTAFVGHAFDVTLVEEDGGWLLDGVACTNPDPTARTPEEVVERFYSWWIHYPGNPLADQMYQGAGLYLTQNLIDEVTETVASFDRAGYDPILLAQDMPTSVSIESVEVDGDTARVMVSTDLAGHVLAVSLRHDGEIWKISGVERAGRAVESAGTPEEMVNIFYGWYLKYAEESNPMVDRAYAASPCLTDALVERVDGIIASFDTGGYDPFLCAQDVPTAFTVGRAAVDGSRARARVYTSFVAHWFDVSLVEQDGGWLIDEVTCANPSPASRSPEEVVTDFYSWYIHYPGDPLEEQIYWSAGLYLTQGFIEEVTETIASFDAGGFDPILLAQDVPEAIVAGPAELDGDTAMVPVSTTFQGHTLTVRLIREGAIWKIDGVVPAGEDPAEANGPEAGDGAVSERGEWNVYRLGRFDVQVMYPADWEAQEARLQDPQSVYPIVHVTTFGPEGVEGRQMVASLEIVEGTLEDVLSVCSLEADAAESVEVAGQAMRVGRNAHGETLYILQAPNNDAVWGVLRDTVNWDDLSEEDRALKAVAAAMAETLVFAR